MFGLQKDYKKQLIEISSAFCDTQFIDIKEKKKEIKEFVKEVERYYHKKVNRIKEDRKVLEIVLKKARKETDETIVNLAKIFEISKSSVGKYIKKWRKSGKWNRPHFHRNITIILHYKKILTI